MSGEFYIGVDLGTTAVKAVAVGRDGRIAASASREARLDSAGPGRLEFDADAYVSLAFDCIRELLDAADVEAKSVKAIGLSSQAQTFVVLDGDGRPLRPAVSWLDVRAEAEAAELSAESLRLGHGGINAIESGPKLLWLKRHEAEVMSRARRVLVIPDYFIFRLTGRAVSDPTTAGSTGLYDRRAGTWVAELLKMCGLNTEMIPEVLFAGDAAGTLTKRAARELGLSEDVLVAVGTNDQSVGAVGAGNVTPGCASMALGTSLAIVVTSEKDVRIPGAMATGVHPVRGLYIALAFAKTSGVVLRWFRDTLAPAASYEELFRELASVPIGSAGVSCLPHFSGTGPPTYNASVRGAFSGLNLSHTRAHVARAVVESLTFTIRENLELLAEVVGRVRELRAIGGGARSDTWLQMIADATGVVVERPATSEAACLGAAEFAMTAAGAFPSVREASLALYRTDRRFEPDRSLWRAYDEAYGRYRALFESLYGDGGNARG